MPAEFASVKKSEPRGISSVCRSPVRQSIVDPDAVVVEGYQTGVMPTTFGETLSQEELDALVAYLGGEGEGSK